MALKGKSVKINMKQSDGGIFPINCDKLQEAEAPVIAEALASSGVWAYWNYGVTTQESTLDDGTFALPAIPKDLAAKEKKTVTLGIYNAEGRSFQVKCPAHILKTGVTTELDAMVAKLKTKTLGTFGLVDSVQVTISR